MRTAWLLAAVAPVLAAAGLAADEAGFVPLFNGTSLDGWITAEARGRDRKSVV